MLGAYISVVFTLLKGIALFLIRVVRELVLVISWTVALYLTLFSGILTLAFVASGLVELDGVQFVLALASALICAMSYQVHDRLSHGWRSADHRQTPSWYAMPRPSHGAMR